jgi:hypothetical protein
MATDMDLARRAAIFLGNGVRSLPSTDRSLLAKTHLFAVELVHEQYPAPEARRQEDPHQQSILLNPNARPVRLTLCPTHIRHPHCLFEKPSRIRHDHEYILRLLEETNINDLFHGPSLCYERFGIMLIQPNHIPQQVPHLSVPWNPEVACSACKSRPRVGALSGPVR